MPYNHHSRNAMNTYADATSFFLSLITQIKTCFIRTGVCNPRIEELDEIVGKLANPKFTVLVSGSFNNGKSTFVNALLGHPIVPMDEMPCSSLVCRIQPADGQPHAVAYFKKSLTEDQLSPFAAEIKEAFKNSKNEPFHIKDLGLLSKYVVFNEEEEFLDESESYFSCFEFVDVFYTCHQTAYKDVIIADSPGISHHSQMDQVTQEFLKTADAFIFVFDATKAYTKDEQQLVNQMFEIQPNLFFVFNKFDCIKQQPRLIAKYKHQLAHKTKLKGENDVNGIHFISAQKAFQAKETNDAKLLEKSGMAEFEQALFTFLQDRQRIKLLAQVKRTKNILQAAARTLQTVNAATKVSQQVAQEFQQKLQDAQRDVDDFKKKQFKEIDLFTAEIQNVIENKIVEIASTIPQKAKTVSLTKTVRKAKSHHVKTALMEMLRNDFEAELQKWFHSGLQTRVKAKLGEIHGKVDTFVSLKLEQVEQIQNELLKYGGEQLEPMTQNEELEYSVGFWIGLGVVSLVTLPITLLVGLLAVIASLPFLPFFATAMRWESVKEQIGDEVQAEMQKKAPEIAANHARTIGDNLKTMVTNIIHSKLRVLEMLLDSQIKLQKEMSAKKEEEEISAARLVLLIVTNQLVQLAEGLQESKNAQVHIKVSESLSEDTMSKVDPFITVGNRQFKISNEETLRRTIPSDEYVLIRYIIENQNKRIAQYSSLIELVENNAILMTDEQYYSQNSISTPTKLQLAKSEQSKEGMNAVKWHWWGMEVWVSKTVIQTVASPGTSTLSESLGFLVKSVSMTVLKAVADDSIQRFGFTSIPALYFKHPFVGPLFCDSKLQ